MSKFRNMFSRNHSVFFQCELLTEMTYKNDQLLSQDNLFTSILWLSFENYFFLEKIFFGFMRGCSK
jgi:hypothetical protein